jgi:hypothetical protein
VCVRFPSESDVYAILGDLVPMAYRSRLFREESLPTDRAFLPPEQFGAGGDAATVLHDKRDSTNSIITKYQAVHACSKVCLGGNICLFKFYVHLSLSFFFFFGFSCVVVT